MGILIPRVIGPEAYGNFNYILSSYSFLFQILMFTSSTAYIYFLSSDRYKSEDINMFYLFFISTISLIVFIITIFSTCTQIGIQYFWNGLDNYYLLYFGFLYTILLNLYQRLIEFSDSTQQTITSEKLKLFSRLIIVLTILTFIIVDMFNIYFYFILSILNFILFFILFFKYISFSISKFNFKLFKAISNDFYIYLKPLILFSFISAIYSYLGKYVLQSSGGSIEQGYYNVASQLALIPVIFISSIMTIYMSEMTKKFQIDDIDGVKDIFLQNIFKIYAIHTFISLFMLVNAQEILIISVGKQFLDATQALQFLTIFSLLHTFGMLSGNLFFSSGRNKEYSIINSTTMSFGIIVFIYILFNFSLNATYLAIIMTLFYGIRVSIQLIININYLKIKKKLFFIELFLVTIIILTILILLSWLKFNLFINLLISFFILIIINFIFKDYMNIKSLKVLRK